jgi:hypothetical protein
MTDQHPITPPPELVAQWFFSAKAMPVDQWVTDVATQAARWGADQELEACCEWTRNSDGYDAALALRADRLPKPPSLKEEALQAAQRFYANGHEDCNDEEIKDDFDTIRRALESLPS